MHMQVITITCNGDRHFSQPLSLMFVKIEFELRVYLAMGAMLISYIHCHIWLHMYLCVPVSVQLGS